MNNTFNFNRFALLLKRQWLEFGKIYLISLMVALGVIIVVYGYVLWNPLTNSKTSFYISLTFREPLFLIFGFLFISITASSYYSHFGQKSKAIVDLLVPSSTLEKFLGGIFFTSILAAISFIAIFYVTDLAFISKIRSIYTETGSVKAGPGLIKIGNGHIYAQEGIPFFFTKHISNMERAFYIIPFFVTSVFLLGSIYFNRFHYIKTAISVIISIGIVIATIIKAQSIIFKNKIYIVTDGTIDNVNYKDIFITIFLVIISLILYSITYLRLKEKEV